MSKAFTKDEAPAAPILVPSRAPLPPGVVNYVTPRGLGLLRAELAELVNLRATLALGAKGDAGSEAARQAQALSVRIADLESRIGSAVVVPADESHDEVRFGARVRLRAENGTEQSYTIVGIDEADVRAGRIAFVAPLARALLGKRVGEIALVRAPHGDDELEIIGVDYGEM